MGLYVFFGNKISRPPRYDRFDIPPYQTLTLYHRFIFLSTLFFHFAFLLIVFYFDFFYLFCFTKDLHTQNLAMVVESVKNCYNVLAKQKRSDENEKKICKGDVGFIVRIGSAVCRVLRKKGKEHYGCDS